MNTTDVSGRPEDRPLHDDVRFLGACLGNVIRRLEGEALFDAVEELRTRCRGRRRGDEGADSLDDLLGRIDELDIEIGAGVARAFTLFFLLINTAEQVHRARRRRAPSCARRRRSPTCAWVGSGECRRCSMGCPYGSSSDDAPA